MASTLLASNNHRPQAMQTDTGPPLEQDVPALAMPADAHLLADKFLATVFTPPGHNFVT